MPLEAIIYPQDPFGYISNCKDFMFHDLYYQEEEAHEDTKNNIDTLREQQNFVEHGKGNIDTLGKDQNPLITSLEEDFGLPTIHMENHAPLQQRRKRRRTRSSKNKEEIENQRMTHIAVERNRRKQMNEYLAVLRSLMPSSYAQRGDQASIVGGAINYVKELEHILQSMEPKRTKTTTTIHEAEGADTSTNTSSLMGPFSDFFTFPQYSKTKSSVLESSSSSAEIEVTVAESHANIKIMTKKKPKQLLKLIASIQSLRLTLLHLNVTTLVNSILYSISIKRIIEAMCTDNEVRPPLVSGNIIHKLVSRQLRRIEEGSQLNTVDDIATALNQIIRRIQEES